ncbi:MAG TPA: glycosyltransferase 87 family protein [Kofleriaceae bacterium]|jgi:hypothetical protein
MRRVFVQSGVLLVFAGAPVVVWWANLLALHTHAAGDFHAIWQAGHSIREGHSPYPTMHQLETLRGHPTSVFVYPPLTAVVFLPLTLVPWHLLAVPLVIASAGLIAWGLWLLGVRDWRCYSLVALGMPAIHAADVGAITPFLLILLAVGSRSSSCAALSAGVAAKLFLAPMVLWQGLERGVRSAVHTVAAAAALILGSWAIIGFAGMLSYPAMLSKLSENEAASSYSSVALAERLGVPWLAVVAMLGAPMVLLMLPASSVDRFAAGIGLCLVATPILWPHYLLLLYAPIARRWPRLSWAWALPLVLWIAPHGGSTEDPATLLQILLALGVTLAVTAPPLARRPAAVMSVA